MRGRIFEQLLVTNRLVGGTAVVRRDVLDRTGTFDTTLRAAENWDLWIRIARVYSVDFVDEALTNYLKHDGGMSRNEVLMLEARRAIVKKHLPTRPEDISLASIYHSAHSELSYRRSANCGIGRTRSIREFNVAMSRAAPQLSPEPKSPQSI